MKHPRCGGSHETVAEARVCEFGENTSEGMATYKPLRPRDRLTFTTTTPPSEDQLNYIRILIAERDVPAAYKASIGEYLDKNKFSRRGATETITKLLSMAKINEITEGMYKTPDGGIYRVVVAIHGSGRLYATKLEVTRDVVRDASGKILVAAEVKFFREKGAIFRLRGDWKMSREDAKKFGELYGVCVRCATELTKPESIERGMGDTCAAKW